MLPNDTYIFGLVVAWLVRAGLFAGVLAILAITLAGCSGSDPTGILKRMSANDAISVGEGHQTRNDEPPSGGCHEKSDSSLRKPSP